MGFILARPGAMQVTAVTRSWPTLKNVLFYFKTGFSLKKYRIKEMYNFLVYK
jgi:hypothetical protein